MQDYCKDADPKLPAVQVQEVGWPSRSLAALPSDCCVLSLFPHFTSVCPHKEAREGDKAECAGPGQGDL